jgi:pyrrolysine biosynthesis protein PylD
MTRLTERDVRDLTSGLADFEDRLVAASGLTVRELALRAVSREPVCVMLAGARTAAVPVSTGEGFIPGFAECVAAVLRHLGCDAWVTAQPDVRGIQEAVEGGARAVFLADDNRFIALNPNAARVIDDDPATADGYALALEAAAGGLIGRPVLLLGLGRVGKLAARRLISLGARVLAVEPDEDRRAAVLSTGLKVELVALDEGLERCDLIYDACPAVDLIGGEAVSEKTIAAVPGLPSAFTAAAREALGARHIHEPLAVGVAVMAARALA